MGRLKFRTSFTQNVLRHSVEVAHLMGMMAGELGLDPAVARRVGFFHDIGKALDHEAQGAHALIGAEFLRQHGESAVVVNGVAAHHEDVPSEGLYGVLCSAADAISSSRPGARTEAMGVYVQRLEKLESIANSFPGVKKTFAVQAGREVRVIVEPGQVTDNDAMVMARDISQQIAATMQFPGQIRVVVVRELRCVEYAK
jgi:ribonuclease Y